MTLTGVHLLLTYQCTCECDHCFVWGSPRQTGTMGLGAVRDVLYQAAELGTVEWIYFEGGEPFLYHPILVCAVGEAAGLGFQVGLVTNAYWATGVEEAMEWLRPLTGQLNDLSLSSDEYHGDDADRARVAAARAAARRLGIPTDEISIAPPGSGADGRVGQLPPGMSGVMFRGRAAVTLASQALEHPWESFDRCPHEDLREPGRVHVDPLGFVHLCQGIAIGNLFETRLRTLCERFDPDADPVVGALLAGGPSELVRRHGLPHRLGYADACHLCYEARLALRTKYPARLAPAQMYGVDGDAVPA